MSEFGQSRLYRDLITIVAVLGIYALVAATSLRPKKYGDLTFHVEAKALSAALRGHSTNSFRISKAPGPSLFFTIPYVLVAPGSPDEHYWIAGFAWTILWVLGGALAIRRAGEDLAGIRAGWLALVLSLAPPFVVYYSFGILAEVPAWVGVAFLARGWSRREADDRKRVFGPAWWATCGGLFVLIACRPNALLVFPIGLISCVVLVRSSAAQDKERAVFGFSAMCAAGVFLLALALSVTLLGHGAQEETLARVMLLGRYQFRTEPWDWRFWGRHYRQGSRDYGAWVRRTEELAGEAGRTGIPMEELEWRWIRQDVLANPILSLRMVATRILAANVARVGSIKPARFRAGPFRGRAGFTLFHFLLNIAYIGVVILAFADLARNRGEIARLWPLWAPWVALLVFMSLTYAEHRYLFPGRPGLSVLAGAFLAHWSLRRSATGQAPTGA